MTGTGMRETIEQQIEAERIAIVEWQLAIALTRETLGKFEHQLLLHQMRMEAMQRHLANPPLGRSVIS